MIQAYVWYLSVFTSCEITPRMSKIVRLLLFFLQCLSVADVGDYHSNWYFVNGCSEQTRGCRVKPSGKIFDPRNPSSSRPHFPFTFSCRIICSRPYSHNVSLICHDITYIGDNCEQCVLIMQWLFPIMCPKYSILDVLTLLTVHYLCLFFLALPDC